MTTDTQGMSPDEIALTEELDAQGMPPEMDSETANKEALDKPAALGDDDGDDEPAAAPAPATAAAPAAAAPAPAAPAPAGSDDGESTFQAPYNVEVPAEAEATIKALRTEEATAFAELMEGNITAEDYRAIKDRTDGEAQAVQTKLMTASVLAEANEQQAQREWKRSETSEFASFKGEGLDYKAKPALLAAYNTNLKALAANPENETKDARWFLREAHRITKDDLGITTKAAAPAPAARGIDRAAIPPTLARTPPAIDPTVSGDEFAHMAALTGADAERAYAKLTPEQQERYLN